MNTKDESKHCKICLKILLTQHDFNSLEPSRLRSSKFNALHEISLLGFQIPSKSRYICSQCKHVLEKRCELRTQLYEIDEKMFYSSQRISVNQMVRDEANDDENVEAMEQDKVVFVLEDDYSEEINNVNMHDYCNNKSEDSEFPCRKSNQSYSDSSSIKINLCENLDGGRKINAPFFDTSRYLFSPPEKKTTIQNIYTKNKFITAQTALYPASVVNSVSNKVQSHLTVSSRSIVNNVSEKMQNEYPTLTPKTTQQNQTEFVKLNSASGYQPIVNTVSNSVYISRRNASCQTKEIGEPKFPWNNDNTPGTSAYIFVKWPSSMKYKRCTKDTAPIVISILRGLF